MDVDAESFIDTCGSLVKCSYAVHSLRIVKVHLQAGATILICWRVIRQYKIGKVGKQIFVTSIDVFRETGQGAFV